ncbi:MAG: hypothetical protein NVSMB18_05140 [Acetobacteraceae bacterium]
MAAGRPPLLLLCLCLCLGAAPDSDRRLQAIQAEERRLAELRVEAASRLRGTETEAASLAQTIEALAQRRQDAERRLAERAAAIAPLLPLAERLALYPAETLLAVPAPSTTAISGLAVLRGLVQGLEREATQLRAEQEAAAAAEAELAAALPRLRQAQAAQSLQAAQLDRQIETARSGRVRAEDAAADTARRAASEAARAETLRGALVAMEAAHARAEQQLRDEAARADRQRREAAGAEVRSRQAALARPAGPGVEPAGGAILPVAGPVVRRWGERTEAGPANGLSFRAPPLGRVVAPCAGRVAFAGPFRSFGVLVILDCGGGYHFVLAGLERLDVQVGVTVQAGEPVGLMPGWDPAAPGPHPALYVELRRDGQPVNPTPFLRARG